MSRALVAFLFGAACVAPHGSRGSLVTVGEASQFVRTGRYDEVIRLCHDFARSYDGVSCEEIGHSGLGRPMLALVVHRSHGPAVMIQAGIHAGEIDGKDAGFWFLRDLLDGKVAPGALDHVDVEFVPVINPDGHERFSKNNRPNQRGPAEMGFRTNAARINLNRDFVKADTLEIQAVLGIYRKYEPIVAVDMHVTDGAKFEQDVSVTFGPTAARDD